MHTSGNGTFPASSDDQWTLIQRVIDDCDYYLVIVGGRYGSAGADGISYTEKEYEYAVSQGKPVMGFIHKDPGSIPSKHVDSDPAIQVRLATFKAKVEKRHCKYWLNADDLGGIVSRSYVQLIKTHPAEGWIKARNAKTTEDLEKTNTMHEQIRILEKELQRLRERNPDDISFLAQGADAVAIAYESTSSKKASVETTWNELFLVIAEVAVDYASPSEIKIALRQWLRRRNTEPPGENISDESFDVIKLQLVSLGLISFSLMFSPPSGSGGVLEGFKSNVRKFWVLTDRGGTSLLNSPPLRN